MPRPFRTPLYPYVPITALAIAIFSLGAMAYFNGMLFVIYVGLLAAGALYFYAVHLRR
jgi:ethanolamine permease